MPRPLFLFLALAGCLPQINALGDDAALELFEQRIMPIFRSPEPSSCVQCHLASVDLKDYILPSSEDTFLSLRDQGLINVSEPEKSKILTLIRMGEDDRDQLAKRIHAKTRQAELAAFAAWVDACCQDSSLVARPSLTAGQLAKPDKSLEVIRHSRKDRVIDSFVRNVWSQRMRCFPCHTPYEIDSTNPQHAKPKATHHEFVAKYGARMNLFKETPEATMNSLLVSSRKVSPKRLPLINLQTPSMSLLVLKPTSKLPVKNPEGQFDEPSSLAPVSHMGGLKMHVDDVSYKSIVAWIEDLSRVEDGRYASAMELPPDNWYPSQNVLRMKDVPESWPVEGRVQLFVHARDEKGHGWQDAPIAFTQGTITPRHFVNGSLMLLKSHDAIAELDWNSSGMMLPPGEYLVKAYVDSGDRIGADPAAFLGAADFRGQLAWTAQWKEGFPNAEVVSAEELSK